MILSRENITSAMEKGSLEISDFEEKSLQPASYDLRVGSQAASSSDKKLLDLDREGFVQIKPGDFVIVITREKLSLSNKHAARFGLTSGFARKGLIATIGAQIDPGFSGRLVVGLTNLSTKSISLATNAPFLTVEFHELPAETEPYHGPYQGKERLEQSEIDAVTEREYASLTEMQQTLQSLVKSVTHLEMTVKHLEGTMKNLEATMKWMLGLLCFVVGILSVAVGIIAIAK